jgi:WD40 repeat protein
VSIAVASPHSPFKGLAPFEDSDLDALLFFGREVESEVIAANLMAARMTVLYGPSGVGKSSVLRAGVAHRLRLEQEVDVVVFSTWTGDPVAALIEAVGGGGDSLVDALEESAGRVGGDLFLILDQFEEYFLYHPPGGPFAAELAEIVRRPGLRVNVLIGMREDALARLDALKATIPNLLGNRLRLERLDAEAGRAAILGPIERYNTLVAPEDPVAIEPELVDDVLHQVTVGRVELSVAGRGLAGGVDENLIEAPFLQLVLARLWDLEAERGSRTLRRDTLLELGGAQRIVENHLERAMAELSPQEKGAAAAMYHFLVTPSGTKIAHGVRDLAGYAHVEEGEAADVLQRLTAERIVRASSENGPSTTRYEIFHDVLADAVLAWRTRFEADRRLEEQRRAHERRQRRLLAIGAAALLGLAVMAAVAVYALTQRSNARHQANVAQAERVKAEQQAGIADRERRQAVHQESIAKQRTKEARKAERTAEIKEHEASAARLEALSQKAIAEGNQRKAQQFANQAAEERTRAQRLAGRATRERNKARQATRRANRQQKISRARELAASAQARLAEDPEEGVKKALVAVRAFRAAGISPRSVESTIRDGLIALRVQAILGGGGAVKTAVFSPDESLVLVAGKSGARLFDRAHGYRMRRFEPAPELADAAFSPDGQLIAGAGTGEDRAVHVWDVRSGLQLATLAHDGPVRSVAFSPNGRFLASGSVDGTARLWSVAGGLPLATFTHTPGARGDDVQSVSFSPDSTRLLTVGGDRFARVFDVEQHRLALALNNVVLLNSAQFSRNGQLVATAGGDLFVRMWDAYSGQLQYTLRTTGQTTDLAFGPDDARLATAGTVDTSARIFDLVERTSIAVVTAHKSGVESARFSAVGNVVTAGRDGKAYIANGGSGSVMAALIGHRGPANGALFSRDGRVVITGSDDGTARIWDARIDPLGPMPPGVPAEIADHGAPVNAVAFSPDGRRTVSAGADGTARLRGPGGSVLVLKHAGPVTSASFSKDSKRVITADSDGLARIWRAADGALLTSLAHGAPLATANLGPNGRIAVTAGRDGSARLWDVRRGIELHRLSHEGPVNDARFSPNGRLVITASDDRSAAIWRVADGKRLRRLSGHSGSVVAAAFSPGGRRVATASADTTARIWNVRSGVTEHALSGHTDALTAVAFNPSGSLLATSSLDRDARVWKVASGVQAALLRIHVGLVSDVAFSADGRWLATAGPGAVGIWETRKEGNWPALPLYLGRGPTRPINDVAFSPRGWRILFGSRDGFVRTYNCTFCGGIKELTAIARARLHAIVTVRP